MINFTAAINNASEAKESLYEEASKIALDKTKTEQATALYAMADKFTALIDEMVVSTYAQEMSNVSKFTISEDELMDI